MPHVHRLTLPTPSPFELPLALHGHGWIALAPHRWDGGDAPWLTPLRLHGKIVRASITAGRGSLRVTLRAERRLDRARLAEARRQLAHMLRLDDDLTAFHVACSSRPSLRWVARRGGGRLLRSATVFEDLMKLLFTTNCSWSLTESMTQNLVDACGAVAPDGTRAFPTPTECARDEAFFRNTVRAGYRARAAASLARRFAAGELTDAMFLDPDLPTTELRKSLLALDGFGPYAAGQALRLLGRYDDFALDSWCRAEFARILGRRMPDGVIEQRYRTFGTWAGLAMWCELTAAWHGE
ncbi:MAG: Fe-S cluster assembly protein HesB [Planctomycetes bacterium]|nr:Fe-S cluster assembly protein HesB [Planctomycetota bacterium]